jgi:DNA-binding FadR family transcriptional regulator
MVAISSAGPQSPAGDASDPPGDSAVSQRAAAAALDGSPVTTTSAPPAPERYRPGYETVAELVLAKIAEEGLQVGDRLPTEREMAAEFGVGRAIIREAVKMLTAMGRITVRKGAGISVAAASQASGLAVLTGFQPTSGDQVRMLFDYRRLIEGEAARCAALNAKPQEVRELAEHAEASVLAAEQDDTRAFEVADARFHTALTRAAHNDFLEASGEIVQTHKQMVNQLLFLGQKPGSLVVAARQHVQIAAHVHDGDAEAAAAAAVAHTDTTAAQFERRIRERLLGIGHQEGPSL